jgi:hypothetical protein
MLSMLDCGGDSQGSQTNNLLNNDLNFGIGADNNIVDILDNLFKNPNNPLQSNSNNNMREVLSRLYNNPNSVVIDRDGR